MVERLVGGAFIECLAVAFGIAQAGSYSGKPTCQT
jgi:hypothetical protein